MPSTITYNFGDVVLVRFPFSSLQATKQRPAVVVSDVTYQQSRPDVILMAVSSRIREPVGFAERQLQDWQHAGLLKPSMFKPVIATLEQTLIIRKLGQLSAADKNTLRDILKQTISIAK